MEIDKKTRDAFAEIEKHDLPVDTVIFPLEGVIIEKGKGKRKLTEEDKFSIGQIFGKRILKRIK